MISNCVGYTAYAGIVYAIIFSLPDVVDRGVHCGDVSVIYPVKEEIIPQWALVIVSILPVGIMFTVINGILLSLTSEGAAHFCRRNLGTKSFSINFCVVNLSTWILYNAGAATSYLLVKLTKLFVGRYRPHFLAVCSPINATGHSWDSVKCNPGSLLLYEDFKCQNAGEKTEDAMKSFPSGHATMAFYCAGFGIAYLEFVFSKSQKWPFFRNFSEVLLFIAAWIVSFSRVADNHHHVSDVIAGAVLGGALGYVIFRRYSDVLSETLIGRNADDNCELTGFSKRSTGSKPMKNIAVSGRHSFDDASDFAENQSKYIKVDLDDSDSPIPVESTAGKVLKRSQSKDVADIIKNFPKKKPVGTPL